MTGDVPWLWDGAVSQVLVQSEPTAGQRFAVGRLDNGLIVLDDVTAGRRLGTVDLVSRFLVQVEAEDRILVAGVDEHADTVTVDWQQDDREELPVINGVWMTAPRTFLPGTCVTVQWHHPDGELRHTTVGPLQRGDLIPNRPAWTGYAPG
jgi:hypothetical protein